MVFIDCEKEFDSVGTTAVLEACEDKGIEDTYTRLLEVCMVCLGKTIFLKKSEKFPIRREQDEDTLGLFDLQSHRG